MKHLAFIFLLVISLLPLAATAQWLWVDKDGRKVFSDRSPPATVPDKDILKRPGQAHDAASAKASEASASEAAPVAKPAAASASKQSNLEKEVAERKKKAEQLEADKRKTEEARLAEARADNCARAKSAKASLDSGMRVGRINSKGEREVMDDAARVAEVRRVQSIIDSDCK